MSYSTDFALGQRVHQHLRSLGIETPMVQGRTQPEVMRHKIEEHFTEIMKVMGLDLSDDSLIDTPKRVAKMFTRELFAGMDYANFPKITVIENKMRYDEMLIERNVKVQSNCEHHILPILGVAHVAYIPNKLVVGLSKMNRVVDFFARRPQVQERLTMQIFRTLQLILDTDDVAVVMKAEHMCVKTRGVQDPCSDTVTSALGGAFRIPEVRAEFTALLQD